MGEYNPSHDHEPEIPVVLADDGHCRVCRLLVARDQNREDANRMARERDVARADAARWKAEAERLREAIKPRGLSAGGGTDA